MTDGTVGTFNLQQQSGFGSGNTALTLGGATLNFDLSATGADQLAVNVGSAAVSGVNTIGITTLGSSLTAGQSYNLISASSGLNSGGSFQFADGQSNEVVTVGGQTYTLTLNSSPTIEHVVVSSGAAAGGGPTAVGGGGAMFTNITSPGVFTDTFLEPTTPAALQEAIGEVADGEINFVLPSQTVQLWELGFAGSFTGDATVTLHFDPSLIGDVPLSDLYVEHYEDGAWVIPPDQVINTMNDTITFETDGFSPFVLAAVPEPSSLLLAGMGAIGLVFVVAKRRAFVRAS
jgi:hypothetical protein